MKLEIKKEKKYEALVLRSALLITKKE